MVQIAAPAGWKPDAGVAPIAAATFPEPVPAVTLSSSASTVIPAEFAFDVPLDAPAPTAAPEQVDVAAAAATVAAAKPSSMFTPPMWWSLGLAATLAIAGLTYVLWPSSSPAVVTETPAAPAEDSPPTEPNIEPDAPPAVADVAAADEPKELETPASSDVATDAAETAPNCRVGRN